MDTASASPPPIEGHKTKPVNDFTVQFADLPDADKIERLRQTLEDLQGAYGRLYHEMEKMKAHQHHGDKLVLPYDHDRYSGAAGTWNKLR